MVEHIKELLRTHDCVIIPGLGGLIGHYEPARRNLATGTMAPPMKRIAFNKVLRQNDGVLLHRLVSAERLSWEEARARLDGFRSEVEHALDAHGAFLFPGIGRLVRDETDNLQFIPILKENLLLDTFGLPLVVAQPIERIKEAQAVLREEPEQASESNPEHRTIRSLAPPRRWFSRVAAVVGLGFLLTTTSINLQHAGLDAAELALFPAASVAEARLAVLPASGLSLPDAAAFSLYVQSYPEPENIPAQALSEPFYVIVGSFLDEVRLSREMSAMVDRGFRVRTLPGPNGYIRLALEFDAATASPAATLRAIRDSVLADAWMIGA